jgi:endonuclease YncB( thermonuclease family)
MSVLNATKSSTKDWRDLAPMEGWCKVIDIYDGDTCWVAIDLNNPAVKPTETIPLNANIKRVNIRIARIDSPEIKGGTEETKKNARAARDYARELMLGKLVKFRFGNFGVINGESLDRYHRQIAELYVPINGVESNFSDIMLRGGHAVLF